MDAQFPDPGLELLYRIVGNEAQGYFPDLAKCLSTIRTVAPKLEYDYRFRKLLDILRTNGFDLD